jgi:hypothetical protein
MKPIIYLYFHSKILKWKGKEMNEKEFMSSFFQWRIPKNIRYLIMKEMEKMGLLKIEKAKPYNLIYLNNYYFNEEDFKKNINIKDEDTRVKNPYKEYKLLT